MTMSLFQQFVPPILWGLPLLPIALITPWIFIPRPCAEWEDNRLLLAHKNLMGSIIWMIVQPEDTKGLQRAFLFTALFLLLMSLNLLGLIPYVYTPTAQLSLNLAFGFSLWLMTVIISFYYKPSKALAHLLPEGTPTFLAPFIVVIETISLMVRPLALAVRLMANLTAGHLLVQLISSTVWYWAHISMSMSLVVAALLLLLLALEIAVALIQAYIFVLLLSLYFTENT